MLILLDEYLGKVEVFFYKSNGNMCHGALISYQLKRKRHFYIAEDIELMQMPFWWASNDLLFFHQLLEVAHVFAPLEGCMPELFIFLATIYDKKIEDIALKRMILCKFLYILGVYPDKALETMPYLFSLISSARDIMLLSENADERVIRELEGWLKFCITAHPAGQKFKTMTSIP